jgi:hypothetical protein
MKSKTQLYTMCHTIIRKFLTSKMALIYKTYILQNCRIFLQKLWNVPHKSTLLSLAHSARDCCICVLCWNNSHIFKESCVLILLHQVIEKKSYKLSQTEHRWCLFNVCNVLWCSLFISMTISLFLTMVPDVSSKSSNLFTAYLFGVFLHSNFSWNSHRTWITLAVW